jgi:dolichol-phosphate mannosyltransferase
MNKLVILIPTFNEEKSIVGLLQQLDKFRESEKFPFNLLLIDDNSPDGTAEIVDNLQLPWVDVLRRPKKSGLGAAYRSGFAQVMADNSYSHVVTMDGDGSHRVEDLKSMVSAIKPGKSIVLGTRWISGGGVVNWPKSRQLLSKTGTRYAKFAPKLDLNDLTGGYRIYSSELLNSLNLKDMKATGYCFQIEMAMASQAAGASIVEVPITFIERVGGVSKMSRAIVIEALWQTTLWGVRRRIKPNADKSHYVK